MSYVQCCIASSLPCRISIIKHGERLSIGIHYDADSERSIDLNSRLVAPSEIEEYDSDDDVSDKASSLRLPTDTESDDTLV